MASRPVAWGDKIINKTITANAASDNQDLLLRLTDSDTITVTRIIGDIAVVPESPLEAVDGVLAVDMAIGVAAAEAFSVNALPDANVDTEQPARGWLYIVRKTIYIAVGAGPVDRYMLPSWHFDVRAARKVDRGILYVSLSTTTLAGASFTTRWVGRIRALCMT